jgi:hypothetical protein
MSKFKNITKTTLMFSLNGYGDFIIGPDAVAELPSDNAHVKTLEATGYIQKVKENINPSKPKK